MTFSNRLKTCMDFRKIKAAELAKKTGFSDALISQYLSGKFEAKNDKISILADALNVNELYLAGFSDDMIDPSAHPIDLNTTSFATPQGAMKFILEQPMIAAYGGYDIDKMSDEQLIRFANKVLKLIKLEASDLEEVNYDDIDI